MDIRQAIVEVVVEEENRQVIPGKGPSLNDIADKAWKKLVAHTIMELIYEGEIKQYSNRYMRGTP